MTGLKLLITLFVSTSILALMAFCYRLGIVAEACPREVISAAEHVQIAARLLKPEEFPKEQMVQDQLVLAAARLTAVEEQLQKTVRGKIVDLMRPEISRAIQREREMIYKVRARKEQKTSSLGSP